MTDNTGETTGDVALQNVSELELLKSRAKMMGITFSNNIGVEALKQKIQDKMDGKPDSDEMPKTDSLDENTLVEPVVNALEVGANEGAPPPAKPLTLREWVYRENMKLIRCRITNLDPKKKDLPGEIITVANEYLGTVRKFIPFGEHTNEGYHIPKVLYEELKTRRFLHITTTRDRRTGAQNVQQRWAPEFSLEVMDPLTQEELNQLAQAQVAAGSVDPNAA